MSRPMVALLMFLLLVDVLAWALIAHSIAGACFWSLALVLSPLLQEGR